MRWSRGPGRHEWVQSFGTSPRLPGWASTRSARGEMSRRKRFSLAAATTLSEKSVARIPQVPNGRTIARGSPRQVIGPYGRACAPTGHLRDRSPIGWQDRESLGSHLSSARNACVLQHRTPGKEDGCTCEEGVQELFSKHDMNRPLGGPLLLGIALCRILGRCIPEQGTNVGHHIDGSPPSGLL